MFQSRDDVRQVYINIWQKMQQQNLLEPMEAIIADIIQLHPEYHQLLKDEEKARAKDFLPEQGETNPFLHMGMHIAIREQAGTDRPFGFKIIYQRLNSRLGEHDAEHAIMECLAESLWQSQKENLPFDDAAYLLKIKRL